MAEAAPTEGELQRSLEGALLAGKVDEVVERLRAGLPLVEHGQDALRSELELRRQQSRAARGQKGLHAAVRLLVRVLEADNEFGEGAAVHVLGLGLLQEGQQRGTRAALAQHLASVRRRQLDVEAGEQTVLARSQVLQRVADLHHKRGPHMRNSNEC